MYNRYRGNSGRVERVEEAIPTPGKAPAARATEELPPRPALPPPVQRRPPSPLAGLSGELGRLLGKLSPMGLDTGDLLLIMVLYLLYRDSGDEEMLIIMAAMFLL